MGPDSTAPASCLQFLPALEQTTKTGHPCHFLISVRSWPHSRLADSGNVTTKSLLLGFGCEFLGFQKHGSQPRNLGVHGLPLPLPFSFSCSARPFDFCLHLHGRSFSMYEVLYVCTRVPSIFFSLYHAPPPSHVIRSPGKEPLDDMDASHGLPSRKVHSFPRFDAHLLFPFSSLARFIRAQRFCRARPKD